MAVICIRQNLFFFTLFFLELSAKLDLAAYLSAMTSVVHCAHVCSKSSLMHWNMKSKSSKLQSKSRVMKNTNICAFTVGMNFKANSNVSHILFLDVSCNIVTPNSFYPTTATEMKTMRDSKVWFPSNVWRCPAETKTVRNLSRTTSSKWKRSANFSVLLIDKQHFNAIKTQQSKPQHIQLQLFWTVLRLSQLLTCRFSSFKIVPL